MQSSMKVMMLVLASFVLFLYIHGIQNYKEIKKVMTNGSIEIEGEVIEFSQIVFQARFFLVLILCLNQLIWFLCYKHLSWHLGVAGCVLSFLDFVLNNEVLSKLAKEPFTERGTYWMMVAFYSVAAPYIVCLFGLIVLVV